MNIFTKLAKVIITKLQKSYIYETNNKPINMDEIKSIIPEMKYVSFKDEKGKEHRFLYKPPKDKENKTNIFLGGTELNLNNSSYQKFLKNLNDQNKDNGLIIPIYPGYHEKGHSPSEGKLKDSCEKIYQALTNPNQKTLFSIDGNQQQLIPSLPEQSLNIIGYSLGGTLAAHLASKANNANKLVLLATPASIRDVSVESAKENGGIQAFIAKYPYLFGEKYNTLESLRGISPNTKIDLISTTNDSFSQGNNSHFNRIENVVKERKSGTYNIRLLPLNVNHEEILSNKIIADTITKSNKTKSSINSSPASISPSIPIKSQSRNSRNYSTRST